MLISDWSSDVCSSDLCVGLVRTTVASDTALRADPLKISCARWRCACLSSGAPSDWRISSLISCLLIINRLLRWNHRSEEHTSELQSLMRISYAVFCLTKKK